VLIQSKKNGVKAGRQGSMVIDRLRRPLKYQALTSALQQAFIYRESQDKTPQPHSPELFRSLAASSNRWPVPMPPC